MNIGLTNIQFIRLSSDYIIKPFDCEDDDLNDFLLNDSKNFSLQLLAVTYLIESDSETVAFFSVFNDKISSAEFESGNKFKKFKQLFFPPAKALRSYPAVKIGRLAVSKNYKGAGYGSLIIDYLIDTFITNNQTGCRFITVDAYRQSLGFYKKAGFDYFSENDKDNDTRAMYLDLYPYLNQ